MPFPIFLRANMVQKTRKWTIARLKEHPKQADLFGDVTDEELKALAENMRINGLQQPIEVLPDGTIVCGYQRVRAARVLGWKRIEVVVRDDLFRAGPLAVETRLIDDNFHRRQLSPLGRARCMKRHLEIKTGDYSASILMRRSPWAASP
jgi:ParB family chromosome partitioning protein